MSDYIRTEEAARRLGVAPQTLRKRLCEHGSYYGLKPRKLPSRRLLWPADEIERLISGQSGHGRRGGGA